MKNITYIIIFFISIISVQAQDNIVATVENTDSLVASVFFERIAQISGTSVTSFDIWIVVPNFTISQVDVTIPSGDPVNNPYALARSNAGNSPFGAIFTFQAIVSLTPNNEFVLNVPKLMGNFDVNLLSVDSVQLALLENAFGPGTGTKLLIDNTTNEVTYPIPSTANILPIKLESFTASKFSNAASQLHWVSSSEVNASHIEVERSSDGTSWETLGSVETKGGYNVRSTYEYLDEALPLSRGAQNIFYYRLKLVDLDGATEYSEIRSVTFDHNHITELSVYPNPAVDQIYVEMSTTNYESTTTKLNIFDVAGRLVKSQTISTNGINQVDISTLARSMYTLKVNYDNQEINKKIVKVD